MTTQIEIDRREFLKTTAKGSVALIFGFYLPLPGSGQDIPDSRVFRPNAWIRITPDNQITVLTEIPEMGQGPRTVDTMMLADELEATGRPFVWNRHPSFPRSIRISPPAVAGVPGQPGITSARWALKRARCFSRRRRRSGESRKGLPGREQHGGPRSERTPAYVWRTGGNGCETACAQSREHTFETTFRIPLHR